MAFSITLARTAQTTVNPGITQSYTFSVTASNGVNTQTEIFRMHRRPLDPIAQTTTNDFDGICTPADIQNLPINAPISPNTYFRVNYILVTYENQSDGEDSWVAIQSATLTLMKSLQANSELVVSDTVTISS